MCSWERGVNYQEKKRHCAVKGSAEIKCDFVLEPRMADFCTRQYTVGEQVLPSLAGNDIGLVGTTDRWVRNQGHGGFRALILLSCAWLICS